MNKDRSLLNETIASPYFIDMFITFGMTALINHKYATDKYTLPKTMLYQFLVKMVTTDLVEEGWITHKTKEVIDVFTSAHIFVGSYNTLYNPLKSQFSSIGESAADALSKALVFGGIPIPNLISIGNLANLIQGKDNLCSGDVPHSPTLDNKYPALEAGAAYTYGMFAKYIGTPSTPHGLIKNVAYFNAGGFGYIISKFINDDLNATPTNITNISFEYILGGFNHLAYKLLPTPLETFLQTTLPKDDIMPVISGLIESGEQVARQNKDGLIELAYSSYDVLKSGMLVIANFTPEYNAEEL